jgi:hypothetical protein
VKVEICKSVEIETEVTIDIDDITSAINDHVAECVGLSEQPQRFRIRAVLTLCNAWHQTLSAITDEMIAEVEPHNRKLVFDAMTKHIERWRPQ